MRELDESAAKIAGFDHAPDVLVVLEGPSHRVRAYNGALARLLGDRDVHGRDLRDLVPEGTAHGLVELHDEVFVSGSSRSGARWTIPDPATPGGPEERAVRLRLTLSPWFTSTGEIGGVVARGGQDPVPAADHVEPDPMSSLITLQDALLPGDVPVVPGLDISARYLLAEHASSAGGDWFDCVARPDGGVALVVGDVVGHGIGAVALMGRLRTVLRDRLLAGEPAELSLGHLDQWARGDPDARAATACVVVVDPSTGRLSWCSAGHPPPLVLAGGGTSRFLTGPGSSPIGPHAGPRESSLEVLGEDEMVLLYADGLLTAPGLAIGEASVALARAAGAPLLDPSTTGRSTEVVVRRTLDDVVTRHGYDDDIVLLAAQRVPRITPLHVVLPACTESLHRLRRDLADWLEAVGARSLDQLAIQHAVGELVTNAAEHAYSHAGGDVSVDCDLDPGGVARCRVSDRGRWCGDAPAAGRGRGLALARGLVEAMEIQHGETGTRVEIRQPLTRPVEVLTGRTAGQRDVASRASSTGGLLIEPVDAGLKVSGTLDATGAVAFRTALRLAGRGGTARTTVDLARVELLASHAVQVLHEEVADNPGLRLHAPPGSVAQQVLDLVRLPHDEDDEDPGGDPPHQ